LSIFSFSLFRLCRNDEISLNIVAKNGDNVEATFNFIERIVRLVAFDNVDSTLLLVWTGFISVYDSLASLALELLAALASEAIVWNEFFPFAVG